MNADNAWERPDEDFYELDRHDDRMKFLLRFAILAPSQHNQQPWRFRIVPDGVEVFADAERRLPIVDPHERELLLGIGAAIANFRVAAARFGYETEVTCGTRAEQNLPVAKITVRETCLSVEELSRLFPAIRQRHTDRRTFRGTIDYPAARAIADFVDANDEHLMVVSGPARVEAARLVAEGARQLMSSEGFREELACCIVENNDQPDGLRADAFGVPERLAGLTATTIRNLDVGTIAGARLRDLTMSSAALMAVTADDNRESLLRAGEVLELLLLTLTQNGVHYSFLNQAVEAVDLRRRLQELLRARKPVQLLLRIGYAESETVRWTNRRAVESVIEP